MFYTCTIIFAAFILLLVVLFMNRLFYLLFFTLLTLVCIQSFGQDTLPKFSVRNVGNNRIIVGWVNTYGPQVKQINIQRSFDSSRNYKTILSVPDPTAVQNGFADTKAPNDHMYYRLFIMQEGGTFFFTAAKRPSFDTTQATLSDKTIGQSKDTITANNPVKQPTAPIVKKPEYIPSFYVYTNKEGYVFINLPDADLKKYRIKFFEDDNTFLFEIKTIKQTALTLDKTNFYHAGWFKFELYNEEKLVEKNKFYLAKDF